LTASPEALEAARRVAPGYDVHALHAEWRRFAEAQNQAPRNVDAAFIGFCRKRAEREPIR
jgi:hypothetical protein